MKSVIIFLADYYDFQKNTELYCVKNVNLTEDLPNYLNDVEGFTKRYLGISNTGQVMPDNKHGKAATEECVKERNKRPSTSKGGPARIESNYVCAGPCTSTV